MPLSSLNDPVDLARAQMALEAAWDEIKLTIPAASEERERTRLAYLIAALVVATEGEDELTRRAIEHYRQTTIA
jgi:hypothetical protein